MTDTNGTNGIDINAFAKVGAELEYVNMLRRQASMKRMFPGIDKKALLRIQREQAAHARSAKGTRRPKRVKATAAQPADVAADRG